MGFVASSVIKDLHRHRRSPLEFAIWVGIPLLIGGLMSMLFGGSEGPQPQAYVLVADQDSSFVSGLFLGALSQEAAGSMVRAEKVALADGEARIRKGDASALLVIPKGFSGAVLREEPAALRLVTNPAQTILPKIVEEMLSIFVDAHFYLHRLFGDELRTMADGPALGQNLFADSLVAGVSTKINRKMGRLERYMNPLLIKLVDEPEPEVADSTASAESGVSVSLGMLFLPSILFMALLFIAQGLSNEFWEEERLGTLKRTLYSPRGVRAFLIGKLITAGILIAAVSLIALACGYLYLSIDFSTLPLAWFWTVLSGIAFVAGMTTLQLFAASQRAANIITMSLIFPLMMAGGSFFPFETMPGAMQAIGRMTPNGWALTQLKQYLFGLADASSLMPGIATLIVAIVVFSLINAWRLRARFGRG